jgi:hypothetical protein
MVAVGRPGFHCGEKGAPHPIAPTFFMKIISADTDAGKGIEFRA